MSREFAGPLLDRGLDEGLRSFFHNFPLSRDPDYVSLWDDFVMVDDDQTNDWTVVKDSSASVGIVADTRGGELLLSSQATTDDDGSSIQGNEIFAPAAGKEIWFETRIKVADADDMDVFVGLTENFASNPEAVLTASNRIGFQINDGSASILCKSEASDVETSKDSEEDAADATYVKLSFHVVGTSLIEFFVNRIKVAEIETNIPTANMAVALFELSGSNSGTKTLTADYVMAVMTR